MFLVVEDTAIVSPIRSMLEGADRDVRVVASGADAVRVLAARDVAVCVVTGDLETATAISTDEHGRGVPIVLVTDRALDVAYLEHAYASGVVDVIPRSTDAAVLRAKVLVFAKFHRDRVAESARREKELANLQAQFLATLGHELRPPLNAIVGWVRMLKDGSIRESQRARALDTVQRSAEAQLELIEEMLDISRMTSHALTLDLAVADLRRIVDDVVETLRPAAIEKQVTLFAALDDDVVPMFADAERLRQIVHRLVRNAVVSTPTEGVVTVSLRNTESGVELAITDTGAGNTAEVAPRMFDGFAIVRHLVELHDGTVVIDEGASGPGRTFIVNLPAGGRPPRTDDEAR